MRAEGAGLGRKLPLDRCPVLMYNLIHTRPYHSQGAEVSHGRQKEHRYLLRWDR